MNKYSYFLLTWLLLLLHALPSRAQYTTATQDGNISAGEYNNNSLAGSNGGVWYMTWDATNLYVAKTGGQTGEPNVLYLDIDPILPVTGGGNDKGNIIGKGDYNVTPTLPFRADVRVFFSDSYVEIRRRTGEPSNGYTGWSDPITTQDLVISKTGTNREIKLSWAALTGGGSIPSSFNWLGYAINTLGGNSNVRYDLIPADNTIGGTTTNNTTPHLEYYYTVGSTANGNSTKPFNLKSYTYLGDGDNNNFGSITVWDFTMNSPNRQISRAAGNWVISGSLVVGAGQVFFGINGNFGSTYVGNVRVTGGRLDMDQTNVSMTVREDVYLTGGQFRLSGVQGGDLNIGRNFLIDNGSSTPAPFQTNDRTVTFYNTDVPHLIKANDGYVIPFGYLTLSSQSHDVTLGSSIIVTRAVNFTQGNLLTGTNYLDLADGTATLATEKQESHVIGQVRITQRLGNSGSIPMTFGNVGLTLAPQPTTPSALGTTTVTRFTGGSMNNVGGGNNGASIERYFQVSGANTGATDLNLQLTFAYRPDELHGIPENNLALYQAAPGQAYAKLNTSTSTANHTITTQSNIMQVASGTIFTLSDGVVPLPVTLVSFNATPTPQGAALLRWVTAKELNNKGFGIERTLDAAGTWQQVGYVATTNTPNGKSYEYTDKSLVTAPVSAQAYYRLRQEDLDGKVTYSPVAAVARQAVVASTNLVLSPVPVDGPSLSVSFAEAGQAGQEVAIINTQGQRMLHFTTQGTAEGTLSLPVANLAAGVYIVRIQTPGQAVRHARFVKL
jgi:hypothetical protein